MNNAFYVDTYANFRVKLKFGLVQLNPVAIGTLETPILQSDCAIAIGEFAGQYNQGECAISIGADAGYQNQSTGAVAMGMGAGNQLQETPWCSIILQPRNSQLQIS
jgi:hypothetical protein